MPLAAYHRQPIRIAYEIHSVVYDEETSNWRKNENDERNIQRDELLYFMHDVKMVVWRYLVSRWMGMHDAIDVDEESQLAKWKWCKARKKEKIQREIFAKHSISSVGAKSFMHAWDRRYEAKFGCTDSVCNVRV